jgi:hypothetical protein
MRPSNPKAKFLNRHDAKKRQGYQGSEEHDRMNATAPGMCPWGSALISASGGLGGSRWCLGGGTVLSHQGYYRRRSDHVDASAGAV